MLTVLIVDDEILCAEGVKCSVAWGELGVGEVFTAYSMKQAQEVFLSHRVDIVLCDVEMPKGSGLDLLSWVRAQGMRPVSILLTSYATFRYAQQAVELGCLDYLLKPVSQDALTETFRRAAAKVLEQQANEENVRLAGYWNDNERSRVQRFWRDVLGQEESPSGAEIRAQAEKEHLAFHENNLYLPVLFRIHGAERSAGWKNFPGDLSHILEQKTFEDWNETVTACSGDFMLAISERGENSEPYRSRLFRGCRSFAAACENAGIRVSCYFGEFREPGELARQYKALQRADADNVTEAPGVFTLAEKREPVPYSRPEIHRWTGLFSEGKYEEAARGIAAYLDSLAASGRVDREVLKSLFQDFLQEFYIAVDRKGVQASLLFADEESAQLQHEASATVRGFQAWAGHILRKAGAYVDLAENTDSIVQKVKKYIRGHLGEEMSRTQLAQEVFLSADYLSRTFRQETGETISDYITGMRMEEAKRLLRETDLPVGDVADRVGYPNPAYFTKIFREQNGVTPAKYRDTR